ncbi:Exc2 family lipoprotein [Escherichia coli]|uniref:Exc2 family lipoprotein n=1 Tax=Escherichia coli TaxID=562 RepID=UPI003BB8ECE3
MKRSGGTRYLYLISLITVAAASACTPKGSVEQYTRHYVYASDDRSDPNFYTNKADTTRMMIPFFQQFREMGEKDKAAGSMSRNGTATHKNEFHSAKFLQSLSKHNHLLRAENIRTGDMPSPEKMKLLADTISAV